MTIKHLKARSKLRYRDWPHKDLIRPHVHWGPAAPKLNSSASCSDDLGQDWKSGPRSTRRDLKNKIEKGFDLRGGLDVGIAVNVNMFASSYPVGSFLNSESHYMAQCLFSLWDIMAIPKQKKPEPQMVGSNLASTSLNQNTFWFCCSGFSWRFHVPIFRLVLWKGGGGWEQSSWFIHSSD